MLEGQFTPRMQILIVVKTQCRTSFRKTTVSIQQKKEPWPIWQSNLSLLNRKIARFITPAASLVWHYEPAHVALEFQQVQQFLLQNFCCWNLRNGGSVESRNSVAKTYSAVLLWALNDHTKTCTALAAWWCIFAKTSDNAHHLHNEGVASWA